MKKEEANSNKFIESDQASITVLRVGPKPNKSSILLNDAFNFIKYNYNCPNSEKTSSEHPCSSNDPKIPDKSLTNQNITDINKLAKKVSIVKGTSYALVNKISDHVSKRLSEYSDIFPPLDEIIIKNTGLAIASAYAQGKTKTFPNGFYGLRLSNKSEDTFNKNAKFFEGFDKELEKQNRLPNGIGVWALIKGAPGNLAQYELDHELGHIVYANVLSKEDKKNWKQLYNNININVVKSGNFYRNDKEGWCEAFAAIVNNQDKLLPNELANFVRSKIHKSDNKKYNESYLDEVSDFMKLNYNCPKEEKGGREGKGACSNENKTSSDVDVNISDLKNIDKLEPASTKEIMTNTSKSLFQLPTGSKLGDSSPYMKSLKTYISVHAKLDKLNNDRVALSKESNKKIDVLLKSYGYDPENPDDIEHAYVLDKEFNKEHDEIVARTSKKLELIEKSVEYYRNDLNMKHAMMIKDYASEHRDKRYPDGKYDSPYHITHGDVKTNATVYVYDNMQIIVDKNSKANPDELYFKIKSMPNALSIHIEKAEILEYSNPDDLYWQKKLGIPTFSSDGCAGNAKMSFFNQGYEIDNGLLAHEAAHLLDESLGEFGNAELGMDPEKFYYRSDISQNFDTAEKNPTWQDAMIADSKLPQRYELSGYVSDYARDHGQTTPMKISHTRRREDFAESIKLYMTDHDVFMKSYPNRTKVLDNYLKEEIDYRNSRIKEIIGESE